jgi:hypothetical protein
MESANSLALSVDPQTVMVLWKQAPHYNVASTKMGPFQLEKMIMGVPMGNELLGRQTQHELFGYTIWIYV